MATVLSVSVYDVSQLLLKLILAVLTRSMSCACFFSIQEAGFERMPLNPNPSSKPDMVSEVPPFSRCGEA